MQGLRQYWWNLFVNGFLMSYLVPVGFRRFILNFMGAKIKGALHGHSAILTTKLTLITTNHSMECCDKRGGENQPSPIDIHDGCWIGANSTILPGSIIEKGCVIAAGSVVKGTCKTNRLYAGVPAKEIRQLD